MSLPWKMGLLGTGRLGRAMAGEFFHRGVPFHAIAGRHQEKAQELADRFGAARVNLTELANEADLIIIAVSDDAIPDVAGELSGSGNWRGKIVLHTSGSRDSGVLTPLGRVGAVIGSIHPLQSFSGGETIPTGTVFGIEGDSIAVRSAGILAEFLGGRPLPLSAESKPLYHAAACVAANYLVTLLDMAKKMLVIAGLQEEETLPALFPLVEGALGNIRRNGTSRALTGPIARGDLQTVSGHLATMKELAPEFVPIYLALAQRTLCLAAEAGLTEEKRSELAEIIGK